MADNVVLPGTGASIASDDVGGGVQVQRAKLTWGPDGTANDADVAANKMMPVQLRHSDGTVVTDATGLKISTASQNVNGQATMANSAPVVIASNQSALAVIPAGNAAHDSPDTGNPSKIGGRARSSEIAAVTNDDRADFISDLVGKQIVLPYANPENFVSGAITTAMTATTSTSLIAAPAAGLRNYITTLIVSNAHATVGTDVVIQDGSGGATLLTVPAAAVYGGAVINMPVPLRQPTAATAIFCANVTTGASTKVSAVGYKGA